MPRPIVALLLAAAVLALLHTAAMAQQPPLERGIYVGDVTDTTGACDDGALQVDGPFILRLNGPGTRIVSLGITVRSFQGLRVGDFNLPVDIAIAPGGRFDHDTEAFGVAVHVDGRFDGAAVEGAFQLTFDGAVECDATFTADGESAPPPVPLDLTGVVAGPVDGCGGGAVSMTVSAARDSLTALGVEDVQVRAATVSGDATFPEGAVPVATDGALDWVYFPDATGAYEIAVSGRAVEGGSGLLTITPSDCGPMAFQVLAPPLPGGGPLLPDVGAGPAERATPFSAAAFGASALGAAAIAAAAIGAFAMGSALALRCRGR